MELTVSERRVLDLIWRKGPIARAELADLTGLNTGSLTRCSQTLDALGLLVETKKMEGARGSPQRPLAINPQGAFAYGVSFSHRYMEVGLVNLAGHIVDIVRQTYNAPDPETISKVAQRAINLLEEGNKIDKDRVLGIGFAVPGDFAEDTRFLIAHPYFPKFRGIDVAKVLSTNMPYRVFLENDCNSAALGERLLGVGQAYESFISVFVCHGIGGGVILNGALYRGVHGNAGGLHAFFPISAPRPSGHDLFDTMTREGAAVRDFSDFEAEGSIDLPGVRPWLYRAGTQLRDALSIVARLFDPEAIVIGGRLPPEFLSEITAIIDTPVFCTNSEAVKPAVVASKLGTRAGVVGAAATVMHAHFGFNRPTN
jgi:predicted NBD/HSP70 family sugar kinase